jgi:hypothetical protein
MRHDHAKGESFVESLAGIDRRRNENSPQRAGCFFIEFSYFG